MKLSWTQFCKPTPRYLSWPIFIAMIGLKNSGIIIANESTLDGLGDILLQLYRWCNFHCCNSCSYSACVKGSCLSALFLLYLLVFGVTAAPGIVSGLDFSTFWCTILTDSAGVMGIVKAIDNASSSRLCILFDVVRLLDTMWLCYGHC